MGGLFHGLLDRRFEVDEVRQLIGKLKFPDEMEIKRVYLLLWHGKVKIKFQRTEMNCSKK